MKKSPVIHVFKSILMGSLFILATLVSGQNNLLQIYGNGGISKPTGSFSDPHMFASQGYHYGGGFDYFIHKFGLGVAAGYSQNESKTLFEDYIQHKYLEKAKDTRLENWEVKYILGGPSVKFTLGKFQLDFSAKVGASQITVPHLLFSKTFFGQSYDIYDFSGTTDAWQLAWSGGSSLTFKINQWLGLQTRADFFSTQYLSSLSYDYAYRDVYDSNRNGVIDDPEYFEAQKLKDEGSTVLSVLNLNMGLVFQFGRSKNKLVKMLPDANETMDSPKKDDIIADDNVVSVPEIKENEVVVEEAPIVNANEAAELKQVEEQQKALEIVEVPKTTYDAPESNYDAEAAEFLYKAGESYFALNDFENALPCFNKLKADPNYPRAQYMFALSLCAMGNCLEGKKEYKDFAKGYKEGDARTLEIIFASQFEKCAIAQKESKILADNRPKSDIMDASQSVMSKEYKIQFIAIKKPDASFPGVAEVGNIVTEYYPNKSVYRYTIAGYNDLNNAASDLYKVRKLGFRDAFIAVYHNGERANTIYHHRK
jgi:tetratricopeptide (TPR) repeat protein